MDHFAIIWESDAIPPSDPVFDEQTDDDDTFPFSNVMQNHIPSTNTSDRLSPLSLNIHGLSSPVSTPPLTRSFVSLSQPGSSSVPRQLLSLSPEPEQFLPLGQFQRGPMVPQKRYRPHTSSDSRRYVDEVDLEPSIYFYTQKPEEGIPLKDAMPGRFARLVSCDEPMFQVRGPSISIRINWPGYQPWSRQIPTRDFRYPPGPITRSRLAKKVARSVARFIAEQNGRQMDEDGDPAWLVGPGKIDVFDLVVVRLDHVSKGSWQAQLQLIRPPS